MTIHPAIACACWLVRITERPETSEVYRAVKSALDNNDPVAALDALVAHRDEFGALAYKVDDYDGKYRQDLADAVAVEAA